MDEALAAGDSLAPRSRDVLVVGSEDWSVRAAVGQLAEAGWTVHRCQDSVAVALPCNALVPGRGCPLDRSDVDVVLSVRGRPAAGVSPGEMGAICGIRADLPIVLAGFHEGSGLAAFAEPVADGADVVSACDDAISAGVAAQR